MAWEWWKSLGSPKYVCSPMVDQSELAFRMLLREEHANSASILCYTPMIHAAKFVEDATYRRQRFVTCPEERLQGGLVAQFCGNDPRVLLSAAKLVEREVDAVDLNLGCPQNIAQKGNYGSYLMRQNDLVVEIVRTWKSGLVVPVTCKIRLWDNRSPNPDLRGHQGTLNFCRELEAAGISAICVHGRTRDQKGFKVGAADWESIGRIRASLSVPVIANGGIESFSDAERCLAVTGAAAVMSAEALLENPVLFVAGRRYDPNYTDLEFNRTSTPTAFALAYLRLAARFPPSDFFKCIKAHVLKLVHRPLLLAGQSFSLGESASAITPGYAAKVKVLGASDPDELGAGLALLDAFMMERSVRFRCDRCEPEQIAGAIDESPSTAPNTALASSLPSKIDAGAEQEARASACDCWREETWYRRHRHDKPKINSSSEYGSHDGPAALPGIEAAHAAARALRKDKRRAHYTAMGFRLTESQSAQLGTAQSPSHGAV